MSLLRAFLPRRAPGRRLPLRASSSPDSLARPLSRAARIDADTQICGIAVEWQLELPVWVRRVSPLETAVRRSRARGADPVPRPVRPLASSLRSVRIRFLLFVGLWTFIFSLVYIVGAFSTTSAARRGSWPPLVSPFFIEEPPLTSTHTVDHSLPSRLASSPALHWNNAPLCDYGHRFGIDQASSSLRPASSSRSQVTSSSSSSPGSSGAFCLFSPVSSSCPSS